MRKPILPYNCAAKERCLCRTSFARRCRSLPLCLLRALECFSRVTKRHRGQETMVCVIQCLKWRHCTQLRLIFDFLYPIALFHNPTHKDKSSFLSPSSSQFFFLRCCFSFFPANNKQRVVKVVFVLEEEEEEGRRRLISQKKSRLLLCVVVVVVV